MPDFRVAETAPEHPKLRAAGLAAAGLWSLAGAYAMRELTDGWVPEYWVTTWPGGRKSAGSLVAVGLWRRETRQGIAGYAFHDWTDHQRTAAEIDRKRAEARERMRKLRNGSALTESSSAEVRANNQPCSREQPAVFARTEDERSRNVHDSLSLKNITQVGRAGASNERADDLGQGGQIPLSDDWRPHAGHARYAASRGVNLEHQFAQFVAHAQANARLAVDWDAAFTGWIGTSRRTEDPTLPQWSKRPPNNTDANIAALIAAGENPGRHLKAIGGGGGC